MSLFNLTGFGFNFNIYDNCSSIYLDAELYGCIYNINGIYIDDFFYSLSLFMSHDDDLMSR